LNIEHGWMEDWFEDDWWHGGCKRVKPYFKVNESYQVQPIILVKNIITNMANVLIYFL
jgi:hypothetical protein